METEGQSEQSKEENKADQQVFLTVIDRMKTGFDHSKSCKETLTVQHLI